METIAKACLGCSKEFSAYVREVQRGNGKFCSLPCFWQYNAKNRKVTLKPRVNVTCSTCEKPTELPPGRLKRSRHGVYFCSRVCKDNGQRIGGIEKIQPPHYGTRQIAEYRKMFSPDELKCIRCGYNEFGCAV